MNRKEDFWKWKLAIHKNRQKISRIVSVFLAVSLVIFLGVIAFHIYQSDCAREALEAQKKDKSPIAASKEWDYGRSGFQKVAENDKLILSADFTTGEIRVEEKTSGKLWYSNPQDREEDQIIPLKSRVHSQLHIKFIDLKSGTTVEYDNYAASIQKGGMEHERLDNGVKFIFTIPATGTIIPVQYTLCEDGLLAEIVTAEIQELWGERYLIESIALLPFFGAGGFEDDGYLFIPDGSGALIDFNNNKQRTQAYYETVYGRNLTMKKENETSVREQIYMPVFGAKCNEHAFFSVITSGESSSIISATTSRKTSSYNQVYAWAVMREFSSKSMTASYTEQGHLFATNGSHGIACTDILMDGQNYAVQYFFLEGEQANYSGMSQCYKTYLQEHNLLKCSNLTEEKYLVLDLYGAVSIEKYVVGVKMPVVTALTTYNDVCEIVKELKAQGVENLIINYIGALDGGLSNKMTDKISTESVLGSKKEFREMIAYLEQEDVLLFLETNPVDLYKSGNGYRVNKDSAYELFDQYGFQYKYLLDSNEPIEDSRWYLLRPSLVPDFVKEFTASAVSWDVYNISLTRLGDALYSDYTVGEDFTSRTLSQTLWTQAMAAVGEHAEYLMVHGGNMYCAPYADVITDTSDSCSNFDMEDQSIPFYQMTFHGNKVMTAEAINTTADYEYAFLKALETGCSLKYNLIYGDVTELVGTEHNDIVSYSYEHWKDIAVKEYHMLQGALGVFAGEEIIRHEWLNENVVMTVYESGATVVVNYGDAAYRYQGKKIEGRNYLVLPGGAI